MTGFKSKKAAAEKKVEPPAWWPAVENILKEYGLQAIDFVADFKEAIAKAENQEPVAWFSLAGNMCRTSLDAAANCEQVVTPLYTSPPQRKPLTDEERNWIVATCPTPRHIIDTVEKMHGIKGEA